jgi:hypothetical protein
MFEASGRERPIEAQTWDYSSPFGLLAITPAAMPGAMTIKA